MGFGSSGGASTDYPSFGLNLGPASLVCLVLQLQERPPHLSLLEEFADVSRWDPFVAKRLGMVIFRRGVLP